MSQQRENLKNEQERALRALNAVKEAANHSDQVEEYNESIVVLRELKKDMNEKLDQVVDHLEDAIDEANYDSRAKVGLEALKKQMDGISEHLKTVEELGKNVEEFVGVGRVYELIVVVQQWIELFLGKATDAEKREFMRNQREKTLENLGFLKENGEEEHKMKPSEMMLAQVEKILVNLKILIWEQKDVDHLTEATKTLFNAIDDIGFAGSSIRDTIGLWQNLGTLSIE